MKKPKTSWKKNRSFPRDWKAYNEELVRRGTFYLDFNWVRGWKREVREMNENKVGAPYQYPESLIELQSVWLHFIDLRGVEGITRQVVEIGKLPEYNDFSTISRRVNKMGTKLDLPKDKDIYCSTDGSGMKMNMSGEYFYEKYGDGKKKFIKVTITGNPYTKDVYKIDVSLEGEDLSEPDVAMTHIAELESEGYNILKFWGDGAFDCYELFDFLDYYDIKSAIKIRKNAIVDPGGGSLRRNLEVIKSQSLGYEKWAKEVRYGRRWTGTEGIFSPVKKKFGERVRATDEVNMLREVKRKFWAYEKIRNYAKA